MASKQPDVSLEKTTSSNDQGRIQLQTSSAVVAVNDVAIENVTTATGEAKLLVSEFPPPPYYYRLAGMNGGTLLQPPPIPTEAITRGTNRAAAVAARAREAERRQRLAELHRGNDSQNSDEDKTGSILGGIIEDVNKDENDEGDVVAVFGEIVEDPLLVEPLDYCDDPIVIRDEVKRLHQIVLKTFVRLVQDLVHRPLENKLTRDELSHNIFLMLQECNKFREHQSRELLIEMFEEQLTERKKLIRHLRACITKSKAAML